MLYVLLMVVYIALVTLLNNIGSMESVNIVSEKSLRFMGGEGSESKF